jgi:hypothetical protein
MSEPRTLRCYEYVNLGYEEVRALLMQRPWELFQRATSYASERARSIVTTLHVGAAGVIVGVDVKIELGEVEQAPAPRGAAEATRIHLKWTATQGAALFPAMDAHLTAWPLSATETQLELEGSYRPPLGALGGALDSAVLHSIAEGSVKHLVEELAAQIRRPPLAR